MVRSRRDRLAGARAAQSTRPPRYRLLTAAAAIPQRAPTVPTETFEAACPACGRAVSFTQVHTGDGIEYAIADHACRT